MVMVDNPLVRIDLENYPLVGRGKVRDLFETEDRLIFVATDRISAFDYVLPTAIPGKGKVLTAMSVFWFRLLKDRVAHHLITDDLSILDGLSQKEAEQLEGRTLIVRKTDPLPAEFIVRGYLAGSGWADYRRAGGICGIKLPEGLRQADRIDPPILTPSTKAKEGHDENISMARLKEIVTPAVAEQTERMALEIYALAHDHAADRGIILCDTKFEFGLLDGELLLIDEVLTPDSSRFWPGDNYAPGKSQESFDKQYVRDYLLSCGWDRASPPPSLPPEVVAKTAAKYEEALEKLTGLSP